MTLLVQRLVTELLWLNCSTVGGSGNVSSIFIRASSSLPEEHENSSWHQEDLIAGNELQYVLLVGCQFVEQVSDEHQTVGAQRLQGEI